MDYMNQLMIELFNMSLSASFVVIVVLFLRVLLKKVPKIYSYLLWIIVFIRFLSPVTIKSALSLIPIKDRTIHYTGGNIKNISLDTGISYFDSAVTNRINYYWKIYTPTGHSTAHMILSALCIIWIAGIIALLAYYIVSYMKLKLIIRTATLANKGGNYPVYETDHIHGPFLLGMIRPRIYVPADMNHEELNYVLDHERVHIKRRDYLVKPICFLAVILHWYNPLVWLSMHMMVKDMELSCDEAVLRKKEEDIRSQYSMALLKVSMKQSGLSLPISFGEINTKNRIKNILNFKKPTIWIGIVGLLILIVASITLLSSNTMADNKLKNLVSSKFSSGYNSPNNTKNEDELLVENRNLYIGNHVKDLNLIGILPTPEGLKYDHIELQTKQEPYEITVYYTLIGSASMKTMETELSNAILLFSTIQNMGICHFNILDKNDLDMTIYRSDMEQSFGKLYSRSSSTDNIKKLKKEINEYITSFRLEESIINVILDENKNDYNKGDFRTESHVILDTEKKQDLITVYAMVLYQEYGFEEGEFKSISGNHMPVAITFQIDKDGYYKLKEYWIPKDGSYYGPSIKKKFPSSIVKNAMDTQKYNKKQQEVCDQKAQEYLKTRKMNK